MNRSMLLLAAVASMFICCGTSMTDLQRAEMEFNATTSSDSEAQKALKEAMAKLALEYAKEAASAAELALEMTKKAVEQRRKACELMATSTPECDEILGKKPTVETPKEEKPAEDDELEVEPIPYMILKIDSFDAKGTQPKTTKPENWKVKYNQDWLIVNGWFVLAKKDWKPGKCYWVEALTNSGHETSCTR